MRDSLVLCQLSHALSHELVSLVVAHPLLCHLTPKLLGLPLQSLLVVRCALLQTSLQFGICPRRLLVHLLGKMHEFLSGHAVLFRRRVHSLAAVLVCSCTVLAKGCLLFSELTHCERIIEIKSDPTG